jgi:hypothetical protein
LLADFVSACAPSQGRSDITAVVVSQNESVDIDFFEGNLAICRVASNPIQVVGLGALSLYDVRSGIKPLQLGYTFSIISVVVVHNQIARVKSHRKFALVETCFVGQVYFELLATRVACSDSHTFRDAYATLFFISELELIDRVEKVGRRSGLAAKQ